jgi:integrase
MKRRAGALINRRNYTETREYLAYCHDVRQNDEKSIDLARVTLDHLLQWATETPFNRAPDLRPTLPAYLNERDLSPAYLDKLLGISRAFLTWARERDPERDAAVKVEWIAGLRSRRGPGRIVERELYSIDQVRRLVDFAPASLIERRDRAMVAFLFLSGMRAGAFVSLPVRSVVLDYCPVPEHPAIILVRQWPDWGVRTKNQKAANTYLLPHPDLEDLREIVRAWHTEVLEGVGERGMWWALLEPDGETFSLVQEPGDNRRNGLARRLRWLCDRAGVTYMSPHKLRHGHIVWAEGRCRSIVEFKAVSQNVMHESMSLTDTRYSVLTEGELAQRLAGLGIDVERLASDDTLLDALAEALFRRKIEAK